MEWHISGLPWGCNSIVWNIRIHDTSCTESIPKKILQWHPARMEVINRNVDHRCRVCKHLQRRNKKIHSDWNRDLNQYNPNSVRSPPQQACMKYSLVCKDFLVGPPGNEMPVFFEINLLSTICSDGPCCNLHQWTSQTISLHENRSTHLHSSILHIIALWQRTFVRIPECTSSANWIHRTISVKVWYCAFMESSTSWCEGIHNQIQSTWNHNHKHFWDRQPARSELLPADLSFCDRNFWSLWNKLHSQMPTASFQLILPPLHLEESCSVWTRTTCASSDSLTYNFRGGWHSIEGSALPRIFLWLTNFLHPRWNILSSAVFWLLKATSRTLKVDDLKGFITESILTLYQDLK